MIKWLNNSNYWLQLVVVVVLSSSSYMVFALMKPIDGNLWGFNASLSSIYSSHDATGKLCQTTNQTHPGVEGYRACTEKCVGIKTASIFGTNRPIVQVMGPHGCLLDLLSSCHTDDIIMLIFTAPAEPHMVSLQVFVITRFWSECADLVQV